MSPRLVLGDALDQLDDRPDFLGAARQLLHRRIGLLCLADGEARDLARLRHLARDLGNGGRKLLGRRSNGLHVAEGLFGSLTYGGRALARVAKKPWEHSLEPR